MIMSRTSESLCEEIFTQRSSSMKHRSLDTLHIRNGTALFRNTSKRNTTIIIANGTIRSIGKTISSRSSSATAIDATGLFVAPGFIDTHIHGDPADIMPHEIKFGTTAILPTISCASSSAVERQVEEIRSFLDHDPLGSSLLGIRIEGPYINKARAGAQPKRFIEHPSIAGLRKIVQRCRGLLKIMTIAPEIEGAREIIERLSKAKVIVSAGHSDATYRETLGGIGSGIRHATHLFNGMRRMTRQDAGVAGASLIDKRVTVEVIADLIHVSTDRLCLVFAMKPKEQIILITDSVRAERPASFLSRGVYRLRDGTIAGSSLTMMGAVKTIVTACNVSIIDAIRCATLNPAKLLGVEDRKGSLARGKDADIVIFDKDFDVKMTIARGRIAYRKRGF